MPVVLRRRAGAIALLAAWGFWLTPVAQETGARGIRLDLAADWGPVLCGGTLRVFSSEGRNQVMSEGDPAPQCALVPLEASAQPVCSGGAVWVLDRDGGLWTFGDKGPVQVEAGLAGATALIATKTGPAVLLKGSLRLPDGRTLPLPRGVDTAQALEDGGYWLTGKDLAVRADASLAPLWTWRPEKASPGPATLADGEILAGDSVGTLWRLSADKGRARRLYRSGGDLPEPPVVVGGLAVFASSDHYVRAVRIASGQLAWQARMAGRPAFGPFLVDGSVLVGEGAGTGLRLLDARTGKTVWTWEAPRGAILRPPAVEGRKVAVLVWDDVPEPVLYRLEAEASHPKKTGAVP
jgi:hypothetical protein